MRGFSVAHQRVAVEIDIRRQTLSGHTELTVVPTTQDLKSVVLNACRLVVEQCFVNGVETEFEQCDVLNEPPSMPSGWTAAQHALYKEKLGPVVDAAGTSTTNFTVIKPKPELAIAIPESVKIVEPNESSFMSSHPTKEKNYEPLTLEIRFSRSRSADGLHFVSNGAESHAYTMHSPIGQATSCWLPCVDGLWSLSTWELEFHVRQLLDDSDPESEILVACNNAMPQEEPDPELHNGKIVKFDIFTPVSAQHIGFAVGPFKQVVIAGKDKEKEKDKDKVEGSDDGDKQITAYVMPSKSHLALSTCEAVPRAMKYFQDMFGTPPFNSYALCFVSDYPHTTASAHALSICSDELLQSADIVESRFSNCELLATTLASQWCGVGIAPATWNDLWLTEGIALFMSNLFLRKLMGNNEFRYRMKRGNDKLCREDVDRPPLANPRFRLPLAPQDLDFVRLKAPLVLYILDRRMTKIDRSFGVARVLTKLFLQSMSGDSRSLLSTSHFMRQCEKISHYRLTKFFDEWIYGSGFPIFRITQRFNKKRTCIEMGIGQVHSREAPRECMCSDTFLDRAVTHLDEIQRLNAASGTTNSTTVDEHSHFQPLPSFTGPMTIRIHEANGTPYEHVVDLRDQFTKIDIPYNTKYKRLRRNQKFRRTTTKDALSTFQLAGGTQPVHPVAAAAMEGENLINCLGDVLMSDREMNDWQLVDWGDGGEEEEMMFNEAFEWLRTDADFEWLGQFFVSQPDYMYASQLQQDRDVVAQLDAVAFFGRQPNPIYGTVLTRTIMDPRYFYGVRVAAVRELRKMAVPQVQYIGLHLLLRIFRELYCLPGSKLPRANDFADFPAYFVQKAIPQALSLIRNQATGRCPIVVCHFILDLLRYNENSENLWSDSFYIASLLEAAANALRPVDLETGDLVVRGAVALDISEDVQYTEYLANVVAEIDKCQRLDRWVPSPQHVVTVTAIKMEELLILAGCGEARMDKLLLATKPDEAPTVRLAAASALLILGGFKRELIVKYLAETYLADPSEVMHSGLLHAFADLLNHVGTAGDAETTNGRQVILARRAIRTAIPLLRETLGKSKIIKQALWEALQSSRSGAYDRRILLEMCQVLYGGPTRYMVTLRTPPLYELKMKRRKDYMMVVKYRSVLRKKQEKHEEKPEEEPQEKLQKPLKLKLAL